MKNKAPARLRKKHYFGRGAMFVLCAIFAVLFLLPTVLTITNSFMSEAEIKSNYGMIFATTSGGYVSKTVNLKFIPDKVTLSQYTTGLIKSPEYLLKLWNSILLVVPIVILQVGVAAVADEHHEDHQHYDPDEHDRVAQQRRHRGVADRNVYKVIHNSFLLRSALLNSGRCVPPPLCAFQRSSPRPAGKRCS